MEQNIMYRVPENEFFNHPNGTDENAFSKWLEFNFQ